MFRPGRAKVKKLRDNAADKEKQLQLQLVSAKPQQRFLLDWSLFETRTESGTLLLTATLAAVGFDLDHWAFQQRTGVDIMPVGQRLWIAPWKSILGNEKAQPAMKNGSVDRAKLFSILEKDLEGWEAAKASFRGASAATVDPKELKEGSANLQKVFAKYKSDELELSVLAAFYTVDFGGEVEDVKNMLRSVIRHPSNQNVFSIGAGGSPKVRRLQTAAGKSTKQEAFNLVRKPRKSKGVSSED